MPARDGRDQGCPERRFSPRPGHQVRRGARYRLTATIPGGIAVWRMRAARSKGAAAMLGGPRRSRLIDPGPG
jgi:hypothetical protein